MPVSKDTTTDRQVSEGLPLFPPTLEGKKLIRDDNRAYLVDPAYLDHLEQYLETRDPDFLFKAIRLFPGLLKGNGRNLEVEEYLIEKGDKSLQPTTHIDACTIVGETIRWWQNVHQWMGEDEEARLAKKLLSKVISPAEILPREEAIEIITEDGLKHVTFKLKGEKPYLTHHIYAAEIVEKYEHAKKVFQETKTKKRYGMYDGELEKKDTLNALHKLGYNHANKDVLHYFNLSNAHTKAISYLCMVHIKCCPLCSRNGLSDDSILRVLKRAKGEVQKQKSQLGKSSNHSKK